MGIYCARQCGQALGAMADPAGRRLPWHTAMANVVVAALAATLVGGQLEISRSVAGQPAAESRAVSATPRASPTGAAGQTHRSHDGAIEFWLPAGAKSETRRSFGTSAGLADRTRITWGDRKTGQLVGTVYFYRGSHDDLAADTQVKVDMLKGLYKTYGSRVTQNYRDITLGEFTGNEAEIQVTGERDNTFRFLYTDDYLVTLEAVGPARLCHLRPRPEVFQVAADGSRQVAAVRSPKGRPLAAGQATV